MGQNGFEFRNIQPVHQAHPDHQVLTGWEKETQESIAVIHKGVDIIIHPNVFGPGRTGLFHQILDKSIQLRLAFRGDLHTFSFKLLSLFKHEFNTKQQKHP